MFLIMSSIETSGLGQSHVIYTYLGHPSCITKPLYELILPLGINKPEESKLLNRKIEKQITYYKALSISVY